MYRNHKFMLFGISILAGLVCCLLKLRITTVSSDVISVVSISSALYLAAYAGIQSSTELKERLKAQDSILHDRTQRFVLNSYFKVALILNVMTIVFVCASGMVAERIAQFDAQTGNCLVNQFIEYFSNQAVSGKEIPCAWLWAELLLNFSSISLFVANLIQMCFIGKFVVNRIPFDR